MTDKTQTPTRATPATAPVEKPAPKISIKNTSVAPYFVDADKTFVLPGDKVVITRETFDQRPLFGWALDVATNRIVISGIPEELDEEFDALVSKGEKDHNAQLDSRRNQRQAIDAQLEKGWIQSV